MKKSSLLCVGLCAALVLTGFQLKPSKSFNAVKYVNIFHRYKNIRTGKENDEFLGL